jgi:hypothetical protein
MEPNPNAPAPGSAPDPFLDEIRSLKESVSAQYGHDVVKLCEDLRREQEAPGRRLIRRKRSPRLTGSRKKL